MWLLDTVTVSELRRGDRANAGLLTWQAGTRLEDHAVSCMTWFEIEFGVLNTERRDPRQGAVLRSWFESVRGSLAGQTIEVDTRIARAAAPFHLSGPISVPDTLIGATALVHDLTVVTRNVKDFARFDGVRLFNPWTD